MERKSVLQAITVTLGLCVLCAVMFANSGTLFATRVAGLCIGAVCGAAGLYFLYLAGQSAPDKNRVSLYMTVHIVCMFGPVVVALFVPWLDALGAIMPQLFYLPVLAVCSVRKH